MPEPQLIPLASAIRALRSELEQAIAAGEGEQLRFALGAVELELQVQASVGGTAHADAKLWVLSLGGKGTRTSEATHTLRLTLTPVRAGAHEDPDRDVLVADELEERGA